MWWVVYHGRRPTGIGMHNTGLLKLLQYWDSEVLELPQAGILELLQALLKTKSLLLHLQTSRHSNYSNMILRHEYEIPLCTKYIKSIKVVAKPAT